MNLDYFKKIIPVNDFNKIEKLVDEKIVSEKQFIQILKKTFKLNSKKGEVEGKIEFYKLLMVLEFIRVISKQSKKEKILNESIKRLMSTNGIETVNEIYSHIGLHSLFSNYNVCNLYEKFPDGMLIEGDQRIPIEIKSRFPRIFDSLLNFYDKLSELFPIIPDKHLIIELRIKEVSNKVKPKDFDSEFQHFKRVFSKFYYQAMPDFPNGLVFNRNKDYLVYSLSLFIKDSNLLSMGMSSKQTESFFSSNKFKYNSKSGIYSCSQFSAFIEKKVYSFFSKILIDDCIKNIKNIPNEPRILAIYSNHFNNSQLGKFVRDSIDNYIKKNKGTCIVGICGIFNERNENIIGISEVIAGERIKELIKPYIIKPELL